jgi:aspartate 1-decarboxylase
MIRTVLKSKIHRATVTGACVDYEGSITIDRRLMAAADILPHEQVQVLDVDNGARLTTYALPGDPGEICVNGAAARLVEVGDRVIVLTYAALTPEELDGFEPLVIRVDEENNRIEGHVPVNRCAPSPDPKGA